MKILITGASGFVGQHLLEDIDTTKYSIRVMTRNMSKKMRILPPGCELVEADLTDVDSLQKALENIDIVVNIAAEVRDPEKLKVTNINGVQNLIEAAVDNKVKKIIHLSSVGVVGMQYSSDPVVIDEQANCFPKNGYELTKLESEKLLSEAHTKYNFQLDIVRPTNVYGEYHPFNALLNLVNHIAQGKPVVSTSTAIVNYVYVKDLTALIIYLLQESSSKGILNVGRSCSLVHFTESVSGNFNKKSRQIYLPQFLINFMNVCGLKKFNAISNKVIYSDEKLESFFKYPYDLKNGIKRTIDYYKTKELIK